MVSEAPKLDLPCLECGIQKVLHTPFPDPLSILDSGARTVPFALHKAVREVQGVQLGISVPLAPPVSVTASSEWTRTEKVWNHSRHYGTGHSKPSLITEVRFNLALASIWDEIKKHTMIIFPSLPGLKAVILSHMEQKNVLDKLAAAQ